MIPLIDDYLSELLESKLAYLKANPDHIDKVLSTSQTKLDRLKAFIQSKPVNITKGFPRKPTELPTIAILLSGEGEEQSGLGDTSEDYIEDIREHTDTLTVITGDKLGVPYVVLPYKPAHEIVQIVSLDLGFNIDPSEYILQSPELGLVGFYGGSVEEGDQLQVTYTFSETATSHTETLYESNYRIEVWTENADLTSQLYSLVKWAMISGRGELIQKGLVRQRLGGSDLDPAPEYMPVLVYRRALTFWSQYIASVPDETVPYITDIQLNQSISFDPEGV